MPFIPRPLPKPKTAGSKIETITPTLGNRIVVVENEALLKEMRESFKELREVLLKIKDKEVNNESN